MSEKEVSFRDRPININEEGHRKWVYAKKPQGKWYRARTIVSWFLLLFFILVPFIKVNGHPLILLDIVHRKFIIFGAIFWAQDTFILALLMLSFILFIILFTVTFGRVWCGWMCPQTIFLEMVFRKIEFLIEGTPKQRQTLDAGPWTSEKVIKKTVKHGIFILISILMTNVFLMWFMGYENLLAIITGPIQENLTGFLIMLAVSTLFYCIYSFFREQICTMVCPYGRMQGVLLDGNSIVVSYDYKRGEPRGGKAVGDCIDCRRCIAVCPTAMDIRNGTQLECINCAACIDECNIVMKNVGKPANLIRYDSAKGIENGHKTVWNARNRAYSAVLAILFGFFIYTLLTRPSVETTILRTPGILYQDNKDNTISNVYNIKIVNKTHEQKLLTIKLLSQDGKIEMAGNKIEVIDQGMYESTFILFLPKEKLKSDRTIVKFGIYEKDLLIETAESTFVGPAK